MPNQDLTKRQQEVFEYLNRYHQTFTYMPTTRDIQVHFKFSSQNAAMALLKAIEKKGYISRVEGRARAIRILKPLVNENV